MNKVQAVVKAPDFTLTDTEDCPITLSSFQGIQPVVLVLLRGFIWPYCRAHLAQLRQDYNQFAQRGAAVLVVGPDGPNAFKKYWQENNLPFSGLADLRSRVAKLYEQEVNLFKLGRMPAMFIIDRQGVIRYEHYGDNMRDIPSNAEVLRLLDEIK